jgi:hypothetical protein
VRTGARADLLLVDANPLEDLKTLMRPSGVMVRGRWLDRRAVGALLAGIQKDSNRKDSTASQSVIQ